MVTNIKTIYIKCIFYEVVIKRNENETARLGEISSQIYKEKRNVLVQDNIIFLNTSNKTFLATVF